MQEISLNFREAKWREMPGFPEGTKVKLLREDGKNKTYLIKLPEGFIGKPHVFSMSEQHFVLEGSYSDEEVVYGPGAYRFIPAGNAHDGTSSENGAIILVIQEPIT